MVQEPHKFLVIEYNSDRLKFQVAFGADKREYLEHPRQASGPGAGLVFELFLPALKSARK